MNPSNRLHFDYSSLATTLPARPYPIIDVHSHIHGREAPALYAQSAALYGVGLTYSMTFLEEMDAVKNTLGDRVRFIAVPHFTSTDRAHALGKGYMERVKEYGRRGVKIVKFWNAPRIYDVSPEPFASSPFKLNGPNQLDVMKAAVDMGMIFLTHVGDPDTWFRTKYRDSTKYGTKVQQYEPLEEVLERFPVPWIAAHMGGYPEDLGFLSNLLAKHPNLHLDCSATKWIVRELSKHPPEELTAFFTRWQGRILFGSDIVTSDAHLTSSENASEMAAKASDRQEAFDLYASRYWALRSLFESNYSGESPIADPDLAMEYPERYGPMDAPMLRGVVLPDDVAKALYFRAADTLLGALTA
jgi:hypothetical protein